MFKIDIRLRLALMAATLIGGVVVQILFGLGFSFIFWLAFIFLAVGYILFGTIASTGELLNKGDIDGAEKRLQLTWKPEWLLKMYRGYYYQLKGFIAAQRKDTDAAEEFLLKAAEMGLPTNTDKASVYLQLAHLHFNKSKFQQVQFFLRELKKLDIKEPVIVEQVKMLEQALKSRPNMGQMMAMQGMKGVRGKMMRTQQPVTPPPSPQNNRKPSSKRKKK